MQSKHQIKSFPDQIKSLNLTADLTEQTKKENSYTPIAKTNIKEVNFIPFHDEIAWKSKNQWKRPLEILER